MVFRGEVSSPSLCPLGIAHADVQLQSLSPGHHPCRCATAITVTSELHEQLLSLLPGTGGKERVLSVCKPTYGNHAVCRSLAADPSCCSCSAMVVQYGNAPKLSFPTATTQLQQCWCQTHCLKWDKKVNIQLQVSIFLRGK